MKKFLALAAAALVAVVFLAGCHSPVAIVDSRVYPNAIYAYDNDAGSGYVQIEFACQAVYGGQIFARWSAVGFKQTNETGVIVRATCPNWAPLIINHADFIYLHQWH